MRLLGERGDTLDQRNTPCGSAEGKASTARFHGDREHRGTLAECGFACVARTRTGLIEARWRTGSDFDGLTADESRNLSVFRQDYPDFCWRRSMRQRRR